MKFEGTEANLLDADLREQIEGILPRYPTRQAAVLPALHLVDERLGYVPLRAVIELAELLGLAPAQVQDTLTFYGFFKQDKPRGKTPRLGLPLDQLRGLRRRGTAPAAM